MSSKGGSEFSHSLLQIIEVSDYMREFYKGKFYKGEFYKSEFFNY